MTINELQEAGAICFSKIKDGFSKYGSVTLTMDQKKAWTHFKSLKKEYGAEQSYTDFYYFKLDEDAREMVAELLTREELEYLSLICPLEEDIEDHIVFPLDDRLLRIVLRLNDEEMLFSTIYFLEGKNGRPRTTWWGNYEKEYVCFKDK